MTNRTHAPRDFWSPRYAGMRQPIWHRLGPVYMPEDRMSATEAMERYGVLADYRQQPTYYRDPVSGELTETGWKSILRQHKDGSYTPIAQAPEKFTVIQPRDIASLLDSPFDGGAALTERWPVDTIGTRGSGFFLTLHAGHYDVGGDAMNRYFLIKNGNDGGTALEVGIIHLRLKCWNTMSAALKSAFVRIRIPHRKSAPDLLRAYTGLVAKLELAQQSVSSALQRLTTAPITDEMASSIIERVFDIPRAPSAVQAYGVMQANNIQIDAEDAQRFQRSAQMYERAAERAAQAQQYARKLHERFNDEHPATARTGWSLLNAVTELLDNKAGQGETDEAQDRVALDDLFGHRARSRDLAFAEIMKACKAAPERELVRVR